MLKDDPELAVARDENSETALHVLARKPSICSSKNQDKDQQNNMLHLAAKLPHLSRIGIVPGAALQMQRELLWFKEIEKIVLPSFREKKNLKGQTPQELFTQEHGELLKSGEQWMKNTANSCILVATIITTIIFASVFNVPGGNDSSKRLPIHLKETWFQVFVI
ncbi:ankyrin repeat-containing protein NPR4-like isoform X2 [Pistacia vera]|uniref:ankyrin repeat-containing protein NPR4-like isoform X2 n=1 Tax=Pistacia vera TaxID=55513 RepID=UPI0012636DC7|nr:ankyrin repeat-containing protein NPR4-like isoform X2 [Pistacia vera]